MRVAWEEQERSKTFGTRTFNARISDYWLWLSELDRFDEGYQSGKHGFKYEVFKYVDNVRVDVATGLIYEDYTNNNHLQNAKDYVVNVARTAGAKRRAPQPIELDEETSTWLENFIIEAVYRAHETWRYHINVLKKQTDWWVHDALRRARTKDRPKVDIHYLVGDLNQRSKPEKLDYVLDLGAVVRSYIGKLVRRGIIKAEHPVETGLSHIIYIPRADWSGWNDV